MRDMVKNGEVIDGFITTGKAETVGGLMSLNDTWTQGAD